MFVFATAAATTAPLHSVAVLPFVNFGNEPDGEYFADGLTEEIINDLAQVPDLRVAGRTSWFYFEGKGDLPEIGRKLGVAHVEEGSVRHAGGVRRITAQLINVADGFHVWSENFDFGSTDLLAIHTKIARAVAAELKLRLVGSTSAAQSLAQNSAEVWRVKGLIERVIGIRTSDATHDAAALDAFQRAVDLDPDNSEALTMLATQYLTRGDADRAIGLLQAALGMDPLSRLAQRMLGEALAIQGNSQGAGGTGSGLPGWVPDPHRHGLLPAGGGLPVHGRAAPRDALPGSAVPHPGRQWPHAGCVARPGHRHAVAVLIWR